ncbi:uncharacterized protein LOC118143751 [Callithrix jacchus]
MSDSAPARPACRGGASGPQMEQCIRGAASSSPSVTLARGLAEAAEGPTGSSVADVGGRLGSPVNAIGGRRAGCRQTSSPDAGWAMGRGRRAWRLRAEPFRQAAARGQSPSRGLTRRRPGPSWSPPGPGRLPGRAPLRPWLLASLARLQYLEPACPARDGETATAEAKREPPRVGAPAWRPRQTTCPAGPLKKQLRSAAGPEDPHSAPCSP